MPFATINGHSLHYTDIPAASDTQSQHTLIFVHGLGSTQNYYFPILPYLTSHRCILFDNYGAGRSAYQPGTETSVDSIGKDALGLLDHLNVDQAIAVGYSMGGMVPTHLASLHPQRIVACILMGPVHPTPTIANVFHNRIPQVQSAGMESMANAIPSGATGPSTTPLQKAFIRELLLAQDPEGYIANCRAIEFAQPPQYADVKCPTLILAGEVDKSTPLEGCRLIFESLGTDPAKKRIEVLKGVGHWYCIERTDEVGPLVKGFIEGL